MSDYHTDLTIDNNTDIDELVEYTQGRIENPVEIQGTIVYNFSTHSIDEKALEDAIENKLRKEKYIIPMQVKSAWMFIQSILPEYLQQLEILMYREEGEMYYAYNNFVRDVPVERREQIKQNLAEVLQNNDCNLA